MRGTPSRKAKLFGVSYFSNPVGKFPLTYHSELMDDNPALFSYSAWGSEEIGLSLLRATQAAAVFYTKQNHIYYYTALHMPITHPLNLDWLTG
jgi:hypothetical protein